MGVVLRDFLPDPKVVSCKNCKTHLTSTHKLMSTEFQGTSGRAYLYEWAINVEESRDIEKRLMTGVHIVRDLSCAYCQKRVGWKYIATEEPTQKYKVGHSILERAMVEDADNDFASGFTEVCVTVEATGVSVE